MKYLLNTVPHSGLNNIVSAKGEYYFGADGKKYIDLESGIWCASLGHNHDKISIAIREKLNSLTHISKRVLPDYIDQTAKKVQEISGIDGKTIFLNTGSEAIEFSIILAKLVHPKGKLISFKDNYVSAYGQASTIEEKINIHMCLSCQKQECSSKCPELANKINQHSIFIFDPFCFSRLILKPPQKLIHTIVKELKKKNGILVIDEITTGMGRTGKWFGYHHFDIKPDIVVLGKALGNGYPVSAVIIGRNIAEKIEDIGLVYYQSHQNDPLGCKIAETVIDSIQHENLISRSDELGELFLSQLKNELLEIDSVCDIRGIGMLMGIALDKSVNVEIIYQKLISKGIIIGISNKFNMLNIIPPLTMDKSLILPISRMIKECILHVN